MKLHVAIAKIHFIFCLQRRSRLLLQAFTWIFITSKSIIQMEIVNIQVDLRHSNMELHSKLWIFAKTCLICEQVVCLAPRQLLLVHKFFCNVSKGLSIGLSFRSDIVCFYQKVRIFISNRYKYEIAVWSALQRLI